MARPIKDGVDYFPKDTDFYNDDKVRLIRAEFGAKGMYILDYLLCELYGKNGYFMQWDKNKCFLVSDGAGCGCSPDFIEQVVQGCSRCSFFDGRVLKVFGVLTSAGIQRRYIRMFNGRDEIQILKEYWLLDINDKKDVPAGILNKLTFKSFKSTGNPDKSTENPDKSTENTQSKVNKSRLNKNKENKNKEKHRHGEYNHVLLTDEELSKLKDKFPDWQEQIRKMDEGIELRGYKYNSHYLAILKWAERDGNNGNSKQNVSANVGKCTGNDETVENRWNLEYLDIGGQGGTDKQPTR